MTKPLIVPASSAVWSLLRQRFGPRTGRALVFLAGEGQVRVEPDSGGEGWGCPRPDLGDVRRGEFPEVFWVCLADRTCRLEPPLADASVLRGTGRCDVVWRVSEPAAAVTHQLTEEKVSCLIARHVAEHRLVPGPRGLIKQPPPPIGTAAVGADGQEHRLAAGITYSFLPEQEAEPEPGEGDPGARVPAAWPTAWGAAHREAYHFYREVVAGGPVGLAALWLLHQPEQAREVLDWTVAHRDVLVEKDTWERSLVEALRGLNGDERAHVGAELARVLRDIGVPEGEALLNGAADTGLPVPDPGQW